MKARKYIQNKESLSTTEMDKYKDFDSILEKLDGGPEGQADNGNSMNAFSGIGKGAFLLLGIAAIVWFAVWKWSDKAGFSEEEKVVEVAMEKLPTVPLKYEVLPLVPEEDIPYEEFIIDAQKDITLYSKYNSIIHIPQNTFTQENGAVANGKVTIKYREFHNPIDLFVAGIPMQYDSAGSNYVFESAGMFEIIAEQNGKKLNPLLEKEITVELVSKNAGTYFNKYVFDAEKGNWIYLDKCAIVKDNENSPEVVKEIKGQGVAKTKTADLVMNEFIPNIKEPVAPIFPEIISNKYAFKVKVDKVKFPELDSKVIFQVDEKLTPFSTMYYDVKWDKIEMEKSRNKERYTVTLSKGRESIVVEAFPAYSKVEYANLKAQYDLDLKKHKDYKEKERVQNARLSRSLVNEEEREIIGALNKYAVPAGFVGRRVFAVNRMGFWNSDHPVYIDHKKGLKVKGYFLSKGGALEAKRSYNVVGKKNVLYSAKTDNAITYSNKGRNTMWILTTENKIAIANPEDFVGLKGEEHTFTMNVYNAKEGLKKLKNIMD